MWLSVSTWLALATAATSAATTDSLYILDSQLKQATTSTTIDSDTARLILASRLGVERYHDAGDLSKSSVDALSRYGRQHNLFGGSGASPQPVAAFLMTEDWDASELLSSASKLQISGMPSRDSTEELFAALALQGHGPRPVQEATSPRWLADWMLKSDGTEGHDSWQVGIKKSKQSLEDKIASLQKQGHTIMVLVAKPNTRSRASYGAYTLPDAKARTHSKRDAAFNDDLEEPFLEPLISDLLANHTQSLAADNSSSTPSTNTTSPNLKGIIPRCHVTKHSCETATRNCTGHGVCKLSYTQHKKVGEDSKGEPCYTCVCSASVVEVKGGGQKTTVWGGPACQKKSVVTPFWLLAGFSVVLLFVIGWAVGLVWEMGEQELPSVIGAGVSGVPKK